MEKISYTYQPSEQGKDRYLLSIDYENDTFEKIIDESNFPGSSHILIADLHKAILDGLEYNTRKEYSYLDIKTIIEKKDTSITCAKEHLIVLIDCNTRTRKRRKEIFSFCLFKKDKSTTPPTTNKIANDPVPMKNLHTNVASQRVMPQMAPPRFGPSVHSNPSVQYVVSSTRSAPSAPSVPAFPFKPFIHHCPHNAHASKKQHTESTPIPSSVANQQEKSKTLATPAQAQHISQVIRNLFVNIDFIKKEITINEMDPEENILSSIFLLTKGKFEMQFLIFLLQNNYEMFAINPQNSFETLQEFAIKKLSELFDTFKIHELILNYFSRKYYIIFTKILCNGSQIWINYDSEMTPRKSEFVLAKNMQDFIFNQQGQPKRMKFWQEIEFKNPTMNLPRLFLCSQGIKTYKDNIPQENIYLKDAQSGKLYKIDESGNISPPFTVNVPTNAGLTICFPHDMNPMTSRYFTDRQEITLVQKKSKARTEFFYLLESTN